MSNVTELRTPIDSHMTVKRFKRAVCDVDWDIALTVGYSKEESCLVVMSSEMSKQDALWLLKQAELDILMLETPSD